MSWSPRRSPVPPRRRAGSRLTAVDVCAGAGGWACAARGLPLDVVLAVDLDETALRTYRLNHPGVKTLLADVREVSLAMLQEALPQRRSSVDVVLAGIPCELVSVARRHIKAKAKDLAGLSALLRRCLQLPGELGAGWWCFEDVPGIVRLLPEGTPYQRMGSGSWSAQARDRVYIGEFPVPAPCRNPRTLEVCLRRGPYQAPTRLLDGRATRSQSYAKGCFYGWRIDSKSPTVTRCFGACGHVRVGIPVTVGGARTWRRLEWQEGAALQGFPDDYVFCGPARVIVKHIAQAVQVDVGRAILTGICKEAGLL